jgi:hypothetical protein
MTGFLRFFPVHATLRDAAAPEKRFMGMRALYETTGAQTQGNAKRFRLLHDIILVRAKCASACVFRVPRCRGHLQTSQSASRTSAGKL